MEDFVFGEVPFDDCQGCSGDGSGEGFGEQAHTGSSHRRIQFALFQGAGVFIEKTDHLPGLHYMVCFVGANAVELAAGPSCCDVFVEGDTGAETFINGPVGVFPFFVDAGGGDEGLPGFGEEAPFLCQLGGEDAERESFTDAAVLAVGPGRGDFIPDFSEACFHGSAVFWGEGRNFGDEGPADGPAAVF